MLRRAAPSSNNFSERLAFAQYSCSNFIGSMQSVHSHIVGKQFAPSPGAALATVGAALTAAAILE
jgi:hypothetical protein